MYKHILIPTDGSAVAEKAVQAGIDFAREAGAKATLFTAVPQYIPPSSVEYLSHSAISLEEHNERSRRRATSVLRPALERAQAAGVDCDTDYAQNDNPYEAIIEAARRHGCDAIFMASHARRGVQAMLHRSQTIEVLTHSDIPTVVYR